MDPQNHIDLYCERLDASFWAEPVNAFSNLGFLLAAFLGFLLWKESKKTNENLIVILIAASVGIGSFIFHTFATKSAMMADIIPIIIFIHYAFILILRRILGFSWRNSILLIAGFLAINIAVKLSPFAPLLNGSMQYVPTLLALFAVTAYRTKKPETQSLLIASLFFFLSISFRSMDSAVCEIFPLGTHFLWHLMNSVTMYLVIRIMVKRS